MGRLLQRLAVLLAFAGVLLVPALARAALTPVCEAYEQATRLPVEWMPGGGEPDHDEDMIDVRVAAMCDARGACVIAPERIFAVSDARIEAAPSCGDDPFASVIGPGPRHSPLAGAPPALADHAVLDGGGLVLSASCELAPPYLPVAGRPLPGFARRIDHPPR